MFTLIALAAETGATTSEAGGIGALGINVSSLIFQVVNFALLLWLLKRFAYKPILNILNQRRATIEESLKNAQTIEETKKALEIEKKRILQEAEKQASEIVTRSREQGKQIVATAENDAHTKAERLMAEAETALDQEVAQARQTLKKEMGTLVVSATEKLLHDKLDGPVDEKLIKAALTAAEKH